MPKITQRLPKRTPKKKRKSVPSLPEFELQQALERLKNLNVDDVIKREVEGVIRAASNPNAKKIATVVKTLPKDRQKLIGKTAQDVKTLNNERMAAARKGLMGMSDEEWQQLVDNDQTN